MDKKFLKLLDEFNRIADKGFVKSVSKSYGNIGLTFENELHKNPDSKYLPDYEGIELKCKSRFSRYPIYLFTVAFDGPNENEIERIVKTYGYPDVDFPQSNVLFAKINFKSYTLINNKYNFILELDTLKQRVYLCIYDLSENLIEKTAYVEISTLWNHLKTKLSNLALIRASKKKINDVDYFRYYEMTLFTLKQLNTFVNLFYEGIISVCLVSRISKSGIEKGRYRNKNLVFEISQNNITKLFTPICKVSTDV